MKIFLDEAKHGTAEFTISTMPATGHVNPFFLTVAKLVERGHEVWWHTGTEVCEKIEATGARFTPMLHTHGWLRDIEGAWKFWGNATYTKIKVGEGSSA